MAAMRRSAIVLLAALAGCTAPTAVEGPVRLGQMAYVGGPRVLPERVIEDSRCPAGTTCVWAGRVVLRAIVYGGVHGGVRGGTGSKPLDLVLGVPVDVADGKLTLVAVTPARGPGRSARDPSARFTFAFEGGY